MQVYKFSETATETAPDITPDQLIEQMKSGARYAFGTDNLMRYGTFKINGWAFDIRDQLKRFVYKQYGSWAEVYAPNKTTARKLIYGRIDEIQEVL